jgi:hypothetical protein
MWCDWRRYQRTNISFKAAVDLLRLGLPQAPPPVMTDRASWPARVVNCSKPSPVCATHCGPGRREPSAQKSRPRTYQMLTHHVMSSMKSSTVIAIALLLNRVPFMAGIFFHRHSRSGAATSDHRLQDQRHHARMVCLIRMQDFWHKKCRLDDGSRPRSNSFLAIPESSRRFQHLLN